MPTGAQTAPLTSWNMYESIHDTASASGANHKILLAAVFSWELDESWISETAGPAYQCKIPTWFFYSALFEGKSSLNVCIYLAFPCQKVLEISCCFFATCSACNTLSYSWT